jgi:hypothetical protein
MTKTFTTVISHSVANLSGWVMRASGQLWTDHLFGILNLGHWDLFEIWFLVLGIFMIFITQAICVTVNFSFR